MIRSVIILLACLLSECTIAQSIRPEIRMERSRFYEDDKLIKPKEVLSRMEADPEAFAAFKKAKANYDASQVFGFIGGFMIGWPLGTALAGGDPQWGLAAGGAAVILASLPFNSAFKKHAANALTIYNKRSGASAFPVKLKFRFDGTGVAIVARM